MVRVRGRSVAGVVSVLVLLVGLVPGADSAVAGNGNANVHVSKSVTSAVLTPTVGVSLTADKSSVLPGDHVSYTVSVSDTGALLVLHGTLSAQATPAADAMVGAYFDDVSTATNAHCGAGGSNHGHDQWPALAGVAGHVPGFTPEDVPPITSGMVLSTTPVSAVGVTYPSSGDQILGTVIGAGATATWDYTATLSLSPSQVAFVTSVVTRIRNSFHVEVSPRGNGAQPAMVDTDFCSELFDSGVTPSGALSDAKVSVSLPSGGPVVFDSSTTPGLASVVSGGSVSVTVPYVVPVPAARGASESSAAYLARLSGVDGKALVASATVSGDSSGGPVSVASQPVNVSEHVPVVAVTKSGPSTVDAGSTASYQVGVANTGTVDASDVVASDSVPVMSPSPVAGLPSTLAAGVSVSGAATYVVPVSQPSGDLTDTASVTWQDANGNVYGPVTALFTSQVQASPAVSHVSLTPVNSGPLSTGSSQVFNAVVSDQYGNPMGGVAVSFGVSGANGQTATATTDGSGAAVFTLSGVNAGTDTVQASVVSGSLLLTSNTASVVWVARASSVTVGAVTGNFFTTDSASTSFQATTSSTPVFSQEFPVIDFNPPQGLVAHNVFSVGPDTRPFTDVTVDAKGNATGTQVAQGNGHAAGSGLLAAFDAEFSTDFQVPQAGDVTFEVLADDGFVLGVGNGASSVSGQQSGSMTQTVFNGLPVMVDDDVSGGVYPGHVFTVHFPSAGTFPVEIDYFDRGGQLSLVLASVPPGGTSSGITVPAAADIFGAGHSSAPSPGGFIAPGPTMPVDPGFALPAGGAITFPGTSGDTTAYGGCGGPHAGADGVAYENTDIESWGGIAGIVDTSRQQFLVGVFLSDSEPVGNPPDASAPPAPDRLEYTDQLPTPAGFLSHDETDYQPGLGQVFFIGDGRSASGVLQRFHVPAGATRLFLGMADAPSYHGFPGHYGDNCGQYSVDAQTGMPSVVAPAATLSLTPSSAPNAVTGQQLTFTATSMGADGAPLANLPVTLVTAAYGSATENHITAITDQSGRATFSFTPPTARQYYAQASAIYAGSTLYSNAPTITATNPSTTSGSGTGLGPVPTISNVTPTDGTIITAPTPISATLTPVVGDTMSSWNVTVTGSRPGDVPVTIGSGTTNNVSAMLDPTVLTNGDYTVTITGTGAAGGVQSIQFGVIVHGNLKPGRFKETFTDLSLPVAGIPIGVQRSYDSFDHSTGDFGSGWTMSLSDYQIAVSRALGAGGWSQYTTSCALFCSTGFSNPALRTVSVTAPDGTQQIFDFTPQGGSEVFWGGSAAFTPRAGTGTTGTLTVDGSSSFSFDGDGNLYTDSSDSTIFNPTRFTLTLKNGTVLVLDTTTGLVSETDPSGNTVTVDASGVHSSTGAAITVNRDTAHSNRVTGVTDSAGRSVAYGYNSAGQLSSVTDVNGNVSSYSYDPSSGLFTGAVDGVNKPIITLTYDADGRVASIAHGSQPATVVSTNIGDRTQTVADPNGSKTTTTTFDDLGDPVSVAVFDGTHTLTTTSAFDAAGRRTDVTDPAGRHQHWVYDESVTPANGDLLVYTDGSGRTWALTGYNSFGQPGQILNPDGGVYVTNTYQSGTPLLVSQQVTGQGPSTYSYYPNGLVHVASDSGGRSVTYAYNTDGYKISQADSSGATTLYTPDSAGRDIKIVDPAGREVVYGFNGSGDVTSVTDPGSGDVWAYRYDTRDLMDQATDPTGAHTSYSFNDAGSVISRTDRNGQVTTYSYDADGNVTSETRPGGDVTTYQYTPLEQLAESDNGSGEDIFTYDASGNLASQTSCAPQPGHGPCTASTASSPQPTVTLGYTYHPDGQQATVTGPAGVTSYNDDSFGRLSQVTDPSNQTFSLGYDSAQRLGAMSRPNGVNDTYSYSPSGDLTGITSMLGATTVASTGYGVDPVTGRVTSRTDQTGVTNYGFEADGILTSVTPPVGSTQTPEAYTSNNFGDRLTGPTPSTASTYTAGSRLSSDGINTYTYDAEGDLKTSTVTATNKTTSYTWNTDHQLTATHLPDGSTVSYGYDPLGRRIIKTTSAGTTRYVWDHWNTAATFDATNTLTSSTVTMPTAASGTTAGQPAQVIEETQGGTHSYLLHDALGSVTGITNQTGALSQTITYSAYGTPTGVTAATALSTFTGYQWDTETGLFYANHRYYNPETGRFISEDPVTANLYQPPTGINPLNPTYPNQTSPAAGQNPYLYTAGDPTNIVDLTGDDILGEAILGAKIGAGTGFVAGLVGCPPGDAVCLLTYTGVGAMTGFVGSGEAETISTILGEPEDLGLSLKFACYIGALGGVISDTMFEPATTGAPATALSVEGNAALGCELGIVSRLTRGPGPSGGAPAY